MKGIERNSAPLPLCSGGRWIDRGGGGRERERETERERDRERKVHIYHPYNSFK